MERVASPVGYDKIAFKCVPLAVIHMIPAEFDNIILSAGPGSAMEEADIGICSELLVNATIPVRH